MSRLSQFFPSGGQKIEFLLVGGGGGGGARGGNPFSRFAAGGGGGQVVVGEDYPVSSGNSYPIIIGSGGAGGCLLPNPCAYSVPAPAQPYYCCNLFAGQPGRSGGTSCFGSVTARGGGGGASSLNPSCLPVYCSFLPGVTLGSGCPGGSGGGSVPIPALGSYPFDPPSIRVPGGNAVGNYPIGNTIKFGGTGQSSVGPSANIICCNPYTPNYCGQIDFAGGGGGAGASFGGVFTGGPISLVGYYPITLPGSTCTSPYGPNCLATSAYRCFTGSLSGGTTGSRPISATARGAAITDHVHGDDGYVSNITGTDEYYGGGGESYQGQNCNNYDYTAAHPSFPYYPILPARSKCPAGGCGGGAYRLRTGGTMTNSSPVLICNGFPGYCIGYQCPADYYCHVLAAAGTGGGGASSMRSYSNRTTGPCASNPNVSDGTNGGAGVLIIRYPTAYSAATVSGNTPISPVPGFHIYKWIGPGSITFNN